MEQDKRIAVLEARFKAFDKVAEESTRTVQRLDNMEGQVHRFTGVLESFLSRIRIDDSFRLVPERRQLTPAPAAGPSHTRSASPSPLLEFPMDEDDPDSGVPASSVNTRTTPSDVQDVGPAPTFRSESAAVPVPEPAPAPSSVDPPHPPTLKVIPATPQGSQKLAGPTPIAPPVHRTSPPLAAIAEAQPPPPPPHPVPRGRSRTPAIDASRLGIREGPTTRARSRSKTPI